MAWDFWKKLTGKARGAGPPPEQRPQPAATPPSSAAAEQPAGLPSALRNFKGGMAQLARLARDPKFRKEAEALVERMKKDGVDVNDKKGVEAWMREHQKEFGGEAPRVETFVKPEPEVGRNEPCPCGSGKKYKKCCGLQPA